MFFYEAYLIDRDGHLSDAEAVSMTQALAYLTAGASAGRTRPSPERRERLASAQSHFSLASAFVINARATQSWAARCTSNRGLWNRGVL